MSRISIINRIATQGRFGLLWSTREHRGTSHCISSAFRAAPYS
ncbi:hypothetical protein Cp1R7AA1_185 [Mesorhizobium phage Cp1R7A-A1]|nr:hypothetical protein Cp1R7AA1_185 [Mesorhizobium phage Cp1R7A-A1]